MFTRIRQQRSGFSLAKRHGFTIVELLVVISIIAVVLSLLLPAVSKAREVALRLQCQSLLRSQGIAMIGYASDSKDFYTYSYVNYSNGGNAGAFPISDGNSHAAFRQYFSYLTNVRALFCPTFSQTTWPGIDTPYQIQKSWTPENDFAMVLGYVKYCGTFNWTGNKPLYSARYCNLAYTMHDPNNEDPPWLNWSYNIGYQRVHDSDGASDWNGGVPTTNLGASGVTLVADNNALDTNHTNASAHNAFAPFKDSAGNNVYGVTGLNEVMADGHARWYSTGNSSDGTAYYFDGQAGSWYVQNGY